MKFLTIALLLSFSVSAQELRSLKSVMSDMGSNLKAITIQIQAGSITPKMISSAEALLALTKESETFTPDTVLSLPNVEQDAAKAKYIQELKDLEATEQEFIDALKAGNLDLAKTAFAKIGAIKKQGHQDYK